MQKDFDQKVSLFRDFVVIKRVTISIVLLGSLIVEDILFATKPQHGWIASGDLQGRTALLFVIVGLLIRSWAAGTLRKGFDLTTEGPYSLCRHPLYLGSLSVMLGFCLAIGYMHDYCVVFGPVCGIYILTMRREEHRLNVKYSDRWLSYATRTPIFFPWRPWRFVPHEWSIRQWLRSREYRALISCLLGFSALEIWRLTKY